MSQCKCNCCNRRKLSCEAGSLFQMIIYSNPLWMTDSWNQALSIWGAFYFFSLSHFAQPSKIQPARRRSPLAQELLAEATFASHLPRLLRDQKILKVLSSLRDSLILWFSCSSVPGHKRPSWGRRSLPRGSQRRLFPVSAVAGGRTQRPRGLLSWRQLRTNCSCQGWSHSSTS